MLSEWDPRDESAFDGKKKDGRKELLELNTRLEALQELLYAEGKHKVLIVLQGMDTAGKDGTIRHVFEGVNPQGVKVASFGVPTKEELGARLSVASAQANAGQRHDDDFQPQPLRGCAGGAGAEPGSPPEVWGKRYDHINEWERMLADEGTTILKFFLQHQPRGTDGTIAGAVGRAGEELEVQQGRSGCAQVVAGLSAGI